MKKINDEIFGFMNYRYAWKKEEMLSLWGEQYPVEIIAQAYNGEDILQIQREKYQKYQIFLRDYENQIKNKIKDYARDFYQVEIDIKNEVKPTGVVFCRDGQWGVLFETKHDLENGLAVIFAQQEILVGVQSDFF